MRLQTTSIIRLMCIALLLSAGQAVAEDGMLERPRLALDGLSQVTVVTSDHIGPQAKLAVADLVRCLSNALGAEVAQVSQLSAAKTPATILVGDTFGVNFDAPTVGLQRDGFVLKTRGGSLLIDGATDYGVANGVYTFLIEQAGVRWLSPRELYEIIPSNPEMTLPELDVRRNPEFAYRLFSGIVGDDRSWERRNRVDTSLDNLPGYGFGHNLFVIFPPSVYGKTHPEYFALVDGKRQVPDQDESQATQPCFTNPDVIRIAAEAASKFFADNPTRTTFSLCTNDGATYCRCPNCAALDEPMRKSKSGADSHSESYFHFVAEVAKRVAVTNPDKFLGCYAYWCNELTPRQIKKLPENVAIELTQDTSQHFDAEYRSADRTLLADWSKVAARVGKYDYYGLGWITPRFFPHLAADDLKFLKASGAAGFYGEAYPNWCITGPQLYVATRLMWDSSLDADLPLDDYCKSAFGTAGPEMRKFYSVLEKYWTRSRKGQWFQGLDSFAAEFEMVDDALIEEAWQCLTKAKPLAIGREIERVVDVEEHFRLSYHVVRSSALSKKLSGWEITGQQDLAMLIGEALRALEMVRLAQATYEGVWQKDPTYRQTYYEDGPRCKNKLSGWRDCVRKGVQDALLKVCDYCKTKLPEDQRDTVWTDLRDRLLSDPTAKEMGITDAMNRSPGAH